MCGIVGLFHLSAAGTVSEPILRRMNQALHHRGPDEAGLWVDGPIGLAMCRLAIIDLKSGQQPISNEDGSVNVVFNGEIYNFQELREELQKKGHSFKTTSDTEVLVHLYEEEGPSFVHRLRGMFAFSLYDKKKNRLVLGRDRLGKKPLLYCLKDGALAWASEMQALMQWPNLPKEIDEESIDLYLGLQYVPSPRTIFKQVKKLPAGHILIADMNGIQVERYWQLEQKPSFQLSFEEAKAVLEEKLKEATRLRLISEVPLGAFLSGGLDSTIVVGLMSQVSSQRVKTFSIGFEDQEFSELKYAKQAADHFKTDHTEFVVKPEMKDVLPMLVRHYGEPYGDSSALPSFFVARETRRHVTVALNGDGGDECFAGYERYKFMHRTRFLDSLPSVLRAPLSPWGRAIAGIPGLPEKGRKAARFLRDYAALPKSGRYQNLVGIFSPIEKKSLYSEGFKARMNENLSRDYIAQFFRDSSNQDFINQLLYVDYQSYLPECLLPKVDIASMANSLECRSPFLDHEVVDFAFQMPGEWKYHPQHGSKWILKETFRSMLPSALINRKKMGFGIPVDAWFRGPLKNYWRDHVLSSSALSRGYFRKEYLNHLYDQHLRGERNHGYRLWILLMLELWFEEAGHGCV